MFADSTGGMRDLSPHSLLFPVFFCRLLFEEEVFVLLGTWPAEAGTLPTALVLSLSALRRGIVFQAVAEVLNHSRVLAYIVCFELCDVGLS